VKSIFIRLLVLAGIITPGLALARAQGTTTAADNGMQTPETAPAPPVTAAAGFRFVTGEIGVSTNVVKGAPFSLEATVESAQTLADGNRIVHRQAVRLYRDSKGRTRREETLGAIGPWLAAGAPPTIITIQDPVSGVSYSLDPELKIAAKLRLLRGGNVMFAGNGKGRMVAGDTGPEVVTVGPNALMSGSVGVSRTTIRANSPTATNSLSGDEGGPMVFTVNGGPPDQGLPTEAKSESLGRETIAGLPADGTRITTTIPANAMGNERPIHITSERWYSSDLQIVLLSKHADPRFGDTTYKVTAIDQGEPAASLFDIPSDYKVVKMPDPPLPPSPSQP
jgi:hypothetical protein